MAKQDKILAGIILTHAVLGTTWTLWIASQTGYPTVFMISNLILAAIGGLAGIGWIREWHLAAYSALVFYLVQFVHIITPRFQWSFTLGFNLNISLGWFEQGQLGFNLFALVMLIWATARAFMPNSPLRSTGSTGS